MWIEGLTRGRTTGYGCGGYKGFTLVEVMAALAIFALAALAAVYASSNHLANLNYMQDKTLARYVASNVLAEQSLQYPPKDNTTGSELFADLQWHWHLDVTETATEDVLMMTVLVRLEPGGQILHQVGRYVGPPPTPTPGATP
ncbi:type II secretion system minor pseudopilin GspI [Pseudidiomarina salinarum]|uniref:type II secretion system minor pseudopilin GspI n=1 Tax=Pseudidiomarina salinarum TaxID=435908 RepID=UPI00068C47A6|nr:type II secretion system minor pseudopilin GspI [Pseudidiomarina salinarum]RUO70908.1 type II secretion system protein GspI [Pseudidiomarina salinarum]